MDYKINKSLQELIEKKYYKYGNNVSPRDFLDRWSTVVQNLENLDLIEEFTDSLMSSREVIDDLLLFIDPAERGDFMRELEVIDELFINKTIKLDKSVWLCDKWYYRRIPESLLDQVGE